MLYSKDKRQNRGQSGQRSTNKVQREQKQKRIPREAWMFVMCVVSKDKKGKMQDNQDKETSTDEVQTEYKRIKVPPRAWMFVLRVVLYKETSKDNKDRMDHVRKIKQEDRKGKNEKKTKNPVENIGVSFFVRVV
jgi:hypothetical protein